MIRIGLFGQACAEASTVNSGSVAAAALDAMNCRRSTLMVMVVVLRKDCRFSLSLRGQFAEPPSMASVERSQDCAAPMQATVRRARSARLLPSLPPGVAKRSGAKPGGGEGPGGWGLLSLSEPQRTLHTAANKVSNLCMHVVWRPPPIADAKH